MSQLLLCAAALGVFMSVATADTLLIEGIDSAATVTPERGVTQATVVRDFGEPAGRTGPVGDPPISTWDYGSFVVYFEYDRVVHTVAKRQ